MACTPAQFYCKPLYARDRLSSPRRSRGGLAERAHPRSLRHPAGRQLHQKLLKGPDLHRYAWATDQARRRISMGRRVAREAQGSAREVRVGASLWPVRGELEFFAVSPSTGTPGQHTQWRLPRRCRGRAERSAAQHAGGLPTLLSSHTWVGAPSKDTLEAES